MRGKKPQARLIKQRRQIYFLNLPNYEINFLVNYTFKHQRILSKIVKILIHKI